MTTITNFLHSNFVDSAQTEGNEVPIWVVGGTRANKLKALKEYLIQNCINANKPLVHVDLGISTLRLIRDCNHKIQLENNLQLFVPHKGKLYFLLQLNSQFRKNAINCLDIVIKHLNRLATSIDALKIQGINKNKLSFSLLIEGFELITGQKQIRSGLQSFINHLSTLNAMYRQVSIFKYDGVLLPEHEFALQRISTCLTQVQNYDTVSSAWTVKSTVRRYTGFSNEQKYVIKTIKSQKSKRLKVEKWQAPKQLGDLKSQQQLQGQLGFVVKKGDMGIKQEGMKQMIYPHLMVQGKGSCSCNKKQCKNCARQQTKVADDQLIILDDEQEDDDDIDV